MKEKIKELLLSKNKDDFTLGIEILDSLGEDLTTEEWSEIFIYCYPHMSSNIFVKSKLVKYDREKGKWIIDEELYKKKYGIE